MVKCFNQNIKQILKKKEYFFFLTNNPFLVIL